jgi:hypothetical protein
VASLAGGLVTVLYDAVLHYTHWMNPTCVHRSVRAEQLSGCVWAGLNCSVINTPQRWLALPILLWINRLVITLYEALSTFSVHDNTQSDKAGPRFLKFQFPVKFMIFICYYHCHIIFWNKTECINRSACDLANTLVTCRCEEINASNDASFNGWMTE